MPKNTNSQIAQRKKELSQKLKKEKKEWAAKFNIVDDEIKRGKVNGRQRALRGGQPNFNGESQAYIDAYKKSHAETLLLITADEQEFYRGKVSAWTTVKNESKRRTDFTGCTPSFIKGYNQTFEKSLKTKREKEISAQKNESSEQNKLKDKKTKIQKIEPPEIYYKNNDFKQGWDTGFRSGRRGDLEMTTNLTSFNNDHIAGYNAGYKQGFDSTTQEDREYLAGEHRGFLAAKNIGLIDKQIIIKSQAYQIGYLNGFDDYLRSISNKNRENALKKIGLFTQTNYTSSNTELTAMTNNNQSQEVNSSNMTVLQTPLIDQLLTPASEDAAQTLFAISRKR